MAQHTEPNVNESLAFSDNTLDNTQKPRIENIIYFPRLLRKLLGT